MEKNYTLTEEQKNVSDSAVVTYDSFEEIEEIVTAKGSGTIGCCL